MAAHTHHSQQLQPGSPGARSDASTPSRRLMSGVLSLTPFKRATSGSPFGSDGGGGGSPGHTLQQQQRSLIPSYAHSVQKREIIRQQEEQLGSLKLQAQHQGAEIGRLQFELAGERQARTALQERLNMQYFKSSLLVDILVAQLLEGGQQKQRQEDNSGGSGQDGDE